MAAKFINIYKHSFIFFLASGISNFIMSIWRTSFIRHVFYDDFGYAAQVENSKLLKTVNRMIDKVQRSSEKMISGSFIYNYCVGILDNLVHFSMRSYSMLLAAFSLIGGLFSFVLKRGGLPISLYLGIFAFSVCLYFVNTSFARLFNGSVFAKWIGNYFGLSVLEEKETQTKFAFWIAVGIVLGVLSFFLNITNFIMVSFGVIGLFVILWKIEIGVFLTIFLIPILPTKYIMGLCMVSIASYFIKLVFTGKASFKFDLTDFFVMLLAIIMVYSVFISYIPSASMFMAFSYVLFILFYFVLKNTVKTKEQLFAIISLVLLSGLLVSAFAILQKVTGRGFIMTEAWIDEEMFSGNGIRVYSTLDNPNVLGEYLLFIIPLAFAGLYYFKNNLYKLVSLGILGFSGVAIILTFSRGAWLGLIFAAILYTLIKDRRLIWLGLILVLFLPILMPQSIIERFTSIGDLSDSSSAYRLNIWLASFKMLKDFWPIGIGLGTNVFVYVYQKFAFTAVYAPHSHNLFLQVIIDLGIWGFLLLIAILFTFYKNFLTKINHVKSSFYTSVSAALCAGMGGYLLQGLTDNVWYNYRVVAFFWVMISISAIMNKLMKEDSNV